MRVEPGDGAMLVIGDAPFVVRFAPFQLIADRDSAALSGVGPNAFELVRVASDLPPILGAQRQVVVPSTTLSKLEFW